MRSPTREITRRWAAAFAAVTLWGSGFAIALKTIEIVALDLPQSDPAYKNPIVVALTGLAGMIFLFGVPHFVDAIIGAVTAVASGAYVMAEGVVGGAIGGATAAWQKSNKIKGLIP